jgi:hypothetical protein
MKFIYTALFITISSITFFSCSKTKVNPSGPSKVDTSKTLISDTRLVGNWDIVTDTISLTGNSVKYAGSPGDYYKFTQYGNLYISEALDNLVDTAIYSVSSTTNQVAWQNLFVSINGSSTTIPSVSPPYVITHVDSTKLILTQNAQTATGPRYEQITFKKHK